MGESVRRSSTHDNQSSIVSTPAGSSRAQRVSYALTKSFVHATVAGSIEEETRLAEAKRGLHVSGDINIVSQVSVN